MAALAGANLIYGSGMIESGVTFDCAQFVMDNEFARMIKHCVGGITVTDETLAVDDIAAVGSFGDFCRSTPPCATCASSPSREFLDRRVREDWQERGSTDLHARCLAKAREVLANYRPAQVDDDVKGRIHAIVERDRPAGRVA